MTHSFLLAFILGVFLTFPQGAKAQEGANTTAQSLFSKGPYVQYTNTTSTEIRVELVRPAPVHLVIKKGSNIVKSLDTTTSLFHVIQVDKLEPNTRYTYTLNAVNSEATGGFVTAMNLVKGSEEFSFLLYGDNRSDPTAHQAVVNAMLAEPSDFLVHTGDFVAVGSSVSQWNEFFRIESPLLKNRCLYSVIGNHELYESNGEEYMRYFGATTKTPYTKAPPFLNYSMKWGNMRFFFLNGFSSWSEGKDREWLDDELKKADHELNVKWRVVVMHHSLYSSGPHGNNERLLSAGLDELFKAYHVDLLLGGHDHLYERGYRNGLRFIVSGGGGAPLYETNVPTLGSLWRESTRHFVRVYVSDARVILSPLRTDGSEIETCAFSKQVAWNCSSPTNGGGTPSKRGSEGESLRRGEEASVVPSSGVSPHPSGDLSLRDSSSDQTAPQKGKNMFLGSGGCGCRLTDDFSEVKVSPLSSWRSMVRIFPFLFLCLVTMMRRGRGARARGAQKEGRSYGLN